MSLARARQIIRRLASAVGVAPVRFQQWLASALSPQDKRTVVALYSDTALSETDQDRRVAQIIAEKLMATGHDIGS